MQRPTGMIGFRVAPGEEQALEYIDDVRITNIAFGEEVKGTGRTVVRVHHRRIPDFDDLDGEDLYDDDEDDEDDEDDGDDEDEDAEDAKAKGVNGAAGDSDEDDEDNEDEEAIEEEEEHTYVLCSLYPGKIEQVSVDLSFTVADDVRFSVTGDNAVEILGNLLKPGLLDSYDEEPDDDEIIDDFDEDDESIDSDDEVYGEIEGDSDEVDDDVRIEEIDDEDDAAVAKPVAVKAAGKKRSAAEADVDDDTSMTAPVTDAELVAAAKEAGLDPSKLSKNQRKKLNKRLRGGGDESVEQEAVEIVQKDSADGNTKAAVATKDTAKKDGKTVSKTVTLPSGVVIEDRKMGTGPQAKAGNRLGMRYVGRLQSGKQFDANTKGKPFTFRLGKGEVIGGWDEGLKGMQVGGERRLVIPPKMGYGARGAPPDIPGKATLVFDVKLVEIK